MEWSENNCKHKTLGIIIISFLACSIMTIVETVYQPSYFVKSVAKIFVFFISFAIYHKMFRLEVKIIKPNSQVMKVCIFIAILLFFVILFSYIFIQNFIDMEQIKISLQEKEHITKNNFIYVALYISLINSFIEEAFFRGFIFYNMKENGQYTLGLFYSAFLFALYHIGILSNWFNPFVFITMILALFASGVILNWCTYKGDSFMCSWPIHIAANLGINVMGMIIL